jgi:antitoxin FitA
MAQVVIRNIDDDVVERLKARAAAEKNSLEQKLREVLTAAAGPSHAEVLAEVDRTRAMTPPRPLGAPLAEDLIREDRDSR